MILNPASSRLRLGLTVTLCTCGFALGIRASEPGATAAEPRPLTRDEVIESVLAEKPRADAALWSLNLATKKASFQYVGAVEWTYVHRDQRLHLQADRLLVVVGIPESASTKGSEKTEGTGDAKGGEKPASAGGGLPIDIESWSDFTFLAEGNVRLEVPSKRTFLEADSLYFEQATGLGVARGVRLHTTYAAAQSLLSVFQAKDFTPGVSTYREVGGGQWTSFPLSIHADVLRLRGFEQYSAEGVRVSTCEFDMPHYAIRAASVDVYPLEPETPASRSPAMGAREPVPGGSGERGEKSRPGAWTESKALGARDFLIDPESTWLELGGHGLFPLPISQWDTRWQTQLPIRSVDVGSSSQYGPFGGVEWNLNYFLEMVPLERILPLSVVGGEARLGFETTAMGKRGFGYGPDALYGKPTTSWEPWQLQLDRWAYHGEAQYYTIHDYGDLDYSTDLPPPVEDRYWGHIWHRQSVPTLGLFEIELSKISDRAFLGEYFETVAKEEKEQENLVYWQRNARDNLALTGLYKVRLNDFQSQTERIPEGKLFLLQEPIFRTGVYTDLALQAAYLHVLPDDALLLPNRGYGRYDVLNELSYPLNSLGLSRIVGVRPFALLRYTLYDEVLDEAEGSDDRGSIGAGVTATQVFSRVWRLDRDSWLRGFLGHDALRHDIVPSMTYTNIFYNSLEPDRLIPVDSTDNVRVDESFSISLRNEIVGRETVSTGSVKVSPVLPTRDGLLEKSTFATRRVLDSDLRLILYPQSLRDNGGNRSSAFLLDNTLSLSSKISVRAWVELDPNEDFHGQRADTSVTYSFVPETVSLTVGDRYTRELTDFVYGYLSWRASEKWNFDAYYSHDFETGRDVQYSFSVNRFFHRFVVSLEYSMDVGEDRNQTFYVNFVPLELWKPRRSTNSRVY